MMIFFFWYSNDLMNMKRYGTVEEDDVDEEDNEHEWDDDTDELYDNTDSSIELVMTIIVIC